MSHCVTVWCKWNNYYDLMATSFTCRALFNGAPLLLYSWLGCVNCREPLRTGACETGGRSAPTVWHSPGTEWGDQVIYSPSPFTTRVADWRSHSIWQGLSHSLCLAPELDRCKVHWWRLSNAHCLIGLYLIVLAQKGAFSLEPAVSRQTRSNFWDSW